MKTLFTMGFAYNPFLGQNATLSMDDKKKLYKDLDQATDKTYAIDDWKKAHKDLEKDLGPDYDAWQLLDEDVVKYGSAATGLYNAMASGTKLDMEISQDDQQAANYWIAAINQMYIIVANHFGKPIPAPAGGAPAAPAASGSPQAASGTLGGLPTPLVFGAGALVVFGAIMLATAKG